MNSNIKIKGSDGHFFLSGMGFSVLGARCSSGTHDYAEVNTEKKRVRIELQVGSVIRQTNCRIKAELSDEGRGSAAIWSRIIHSLSIA